jgi:hypothetical protein
VGHCAPAQTLSFVFWWDWSLNSGLCVCKTGALVHFVVVILEMGPHKQFAQAELKPRSSPSQ